MHTITCHQCGARFEAVRPHACFCSPRCRTAHHRQKNPAPPQNRRTSPTKKRRENELFDLNMVLCETYYRMKPEDRPGYLERLIDRAAAGEARIREVLTNLILLRVKEGSRATNYRKSRAYPTIAQEAHQFTTSTWGVHLKDAVRSP